MHTAQTLTVGENLETKQTVYKTIRKYALQTVHEKTYKYETEKELTTRKHISSFLRRHFANEAIEHIVIIAVNANNKIIGTQVVTGTPNSSSIQPQTVFAFLLVSGACSFFLAHNHPAGSTTPSEPDWILTNKIKEIGVLLNLPLLDHVIVTAKTEISMRESPKW